MAMTIEEYLDYTPTLEQKQERRNAFLKAHTGTSNPTIQHIIQEIQDRVNLCPGRILN